MAKITIEVDDADFEMLENYAEFEAQFDKTAQAVLQRLVDTYINAHYRAHSNEHQWFSNMHLMKLDKAYKREDFRNS